MARRWDTKEDVLKDLEAVAPGQRVDEIDDDYFIYGEQAPPPQHYDDEEDEIELRFGRAAATNLLAGGDNSGPDLSGITQMLRMVQKYEEASDEDEESIFSSKKGIVISKGNFNELGIKDITPKTNGSSPKLATSKKLVVNGKKINEAIIGNTPTYIQKERNNAEQIPNSTDINDKVKPTGAIPKRKYSSKEVLNGNPSIEKTEHHGIVNSTQINAIDKINRISNKEALNDVVNCLSNENKALNATFSSKLNPNVKEFIPKSTLTRTYVQTSPYNESYVNNTIDLNIPINPYSVHNINNQFVAHNPLNSSYGNQTIPNVNNEIKNCKSNTEANLKLEYIPNNESYESNCSSFKVLTEVSLSTDKSESQKEAKIDSKNDVHSKDEKKRIATMLKNQIVAKNDTLEEQRKTNKAIFKLLQLYAEPKPPVKLLTPEFFANTHESINKTQETGLIADSSIELASSIHCVDEVSNIHLTDKIKKDLKDIEHEKTDVADSLYKNKNDVAYTINKGDKLSYLKNDNAICQHHVEEFNQVLDVSNEMTHLTPELNDININASNPNAELLDPYVIKESIDKVNNWLNDKPVVDAGKVTVPLKTIQEPKKPLSPMSPVLNASAVTYKRKDPATCKSPLSEVIVKKISKSDIPEFKPSSYAGELHKKYTERSKVATPTPTLNIWEKLEADLKAKDSEIKNRKKASSKSLSCDS